MEYLTDKLTICIVSDGTGITAETIVSSVMNCFDTESNLIRFLFVDTFDKAHKVVNEINQYINRYQERKFIVISTIINTQIKEFLDQNCHCEVINPIERIINKISNYIKVPPQRKTGRFTNIVNTESYNQRMEAINYTISHDDGQTTSNFLLADVIIIGVSRSAKTPTSVYLAMHYGLKVANYPLIPEDFERQQLPSQLLEYKHKIFGLSIEPKRLSEIRFERMPNSKYASLENCKYEIAKAEELMNFYGINWISSTKKSIEEISALIVQKIIKQN